MKASSIPLFISTATYLLAVNFAQLLPDRGRF